MFLLHWEVYVLVELAVNLQNEDLHWLCGKRMMVACICVLIGCRL